MRITGNPSKAGKARTKGSSAIGALPLCMGLMTIAAPLIVQADSPSANSESRNYNIAAQPLYAALSALAEQSGVQFVYNSELVKGLSSPGVRGQHSLDGALRQILSGARIGYRFNNGNSVTLQKMSESEPQSATTMPAVTVTGIKDNDVEHDEKTFGLQLNTKQTVSSRLGLTQRETPATVNVVTQEKIQQQGIRNVIEAYISAPGVSAGNLPGEPGVTSMRGFSRAATGYMVDGMRVVDSLIVSRNFDSWNFERIEFLKGPASVINGTGALAGAINLVTKKPNHDKRSLEGLVSYGSFDTLRAAVGGNLPVNDVLALRGDLSYNESGGYINDTDSRAIGLTTGASFKPSDRWSFNVDFDYFHDHLDTPYQGTPLVPIGIAHDPSNLVSTANGMVIDKALRNRNYNVDNGIMESENFWVRTNAEFRINDEWRLINEAGYFYADRLWGNSEDYTYNSRTGLLDRTTTGITHRQNVWSERLYTKFDGNIGQFHNRFVTGFEYIANSVDSNRRFGNTTSVDPFSPNRGLFPDDTSANYSTRQDFETGMDTWSAFLEDALNLTPEWLIIGGLRFESNDLDRRLKDLNASSTAHFGRVYDSFSYRFGTVYDLTTNTQIYGQYSRAVSPVTTLVLSTSAQRANFDLSMGETFEAGVKTSFWDDRATLTTAFYHIIQDDILTRDPNRPALTVQGGSQRSEGIEVDLALALTPQWRVNANAAFVDAQFTQLLEAGGVNRAGNTPPNVVPRIINFSTYYTLADIPLTFGAIVRHSDGFFTDNANSIKVADRTTLDLSMSYKLKSVGIFTVRGRNMTDAFYADWSGYSSSQVYLGAPRSVDVTWSTSF